MLSASLSPSTPGEPSIFGLEAGSLPWVLRHGHVRLASNGALRVNVAGLIVPSKGSNPIPDLAATVFCNGSPAATTAPVAFSPRGNAHLRTTVELPSFCPAPTVLLHPATGSTPSDVVPNVYIAFDGQA